MTPHPKELEVSITVERPAGHVLLSHYRKLLDILWKGPGDPVTVADHEASALIMQTLFAEFPEDGILSEEAPPPAERQNRRLWIVDPMDGTREFINHLDEFSVMIGLVVAGRPILGVIYLPIADKLYHALAGMGTFVTQDGRTTRLHVVKGQDPLRMILARSRSHHSKDTDRICKHLGIARSVISGSVGIKIGMIFEGLADLYMHTGPETSVWDSCAPEIILAEAGRRMTDCTGEPLRYNAAELCNTRGILASTGAIHDRIVEAIADVRTVSGR